MDILHILLRPTRALRSPFTRASSFLLSSSVTPALSFVPNDISFIPHIVPSHSLPWTHIHHYQRPVEPPIPPQINKLTRVPPFAPRREPLMGCDAWREGVGHWNFERIVALVASAAAGRLREKNWASKKEDFALPSTS